MSFAALLDHLFALRPLLWIPAVALFEAGRTLGAPAGRGWQADSWGAGAIAGLVSLLFVLGAVHVANALRDFESDRHNRKGWIVVRGIVGGRSLMWLGVSCLVAAGVASLAVSAPGRATLLASLLLGAAYVWPGIELKRRSGWDLAANSLGYGGLAFLLGTQSGNHGSPWSGGSALSFAIQAAPYVLGVAAITLCTMLADRDGDAASGQRTSAVVLGERAGAACAAGLAWACALAGFLARDLLPLVWGSVAGVALSLGQDRLRGRDAWNRAAILLQCFFIAALVPRAWLPLAWALAWGAAASVYYRARFGVTYPVRALRRAGNGAAD